MKKSILVSNNISIKQALLKFSLTAEKCLLIVDKNKVLLGTLTDGDVRKAIINNLDVNRKILNIYNKKPKYLIFNKWNKKSAMRYLKETGTNLLPLVDNKKKVIDYLKWEDLITSSNNFKKINRNIDAVIMAGGKGTRLNPISKILPKPLIPVNGVPFINIILDNFKKAGIKKFKITINYKSLLLKSYFKEYSKDIKISIFEEKKPLGTIGSLYNLKKKLSDIFILSNCDTLIDTSLSNIINYHKEKKNDLTIVAAIRDFKLPYAYCNVSKSGDLIKMVEKPEYNFLINTGFYVLNKKVLNIIPKNKFYNFDDFIQDLKRKNSKVGVYPIEKSSWSDIGKWDEYEKTSLKLKK